MGFCFNYSLHLFPLFLIALRQPYRSPQLILEPLSTLYNFFGPFFPCPQYYSNIPLISYLPLTPHHQPFHWLHPPVPNLPPVLPSFRLPLPFLSSLSPPPLPHRLSLPCLLGIAFKTVGSVAYSNPTNTETTSDHKISLSFSISVLHDKASMGLLKQHFR